MTKITLHKWVVIFTVVSASMLQLIDTSIVNVTRADMMGNLGATFSETGIRTYSGRIYHRSSLLALGFLYQYSHARLKVNINAYDPQAVPRLKMLTNKFVHDRFSLATAKTKALTLIHGLVGEQAMLLTYNDVFYLIGIFFLICIPLLLLFIKKRKRKFNLRSCNL